MKIAENCVVEFDYTLTDANSDVLDSSDGREPLRYLHGGQGIIPGLEKALAGRVAGDAFEVTVQPEDGYGPVVPELIQTAPMSAFEGVDGLAPGMQLQAQGEDGQANVVTVREITGDGVSLDGNHPLAGQVLHFDVEVRAVRAATDDEKAHGHAH